MKKTKIFAMLTLCVFLLAGCTSEQPDTTTSEKMENTDTSEEIVVIITPPELAIPEGKVLETVVVNNVGLVTTDIEYSGDSSYSEINVNEAVVFKYYEDESGTYAVLDSTGYTQEMFDTLSEEEKQAAVAEEMGIDVENVTDADMETFVQTALEESVMTGYTSSSEEGYEKFIDPIDYGVIEEVLDNYDKDLAVLTEEKDTYSLSYQADVLNQNTLVIEKFDISVILDKKTSEIMQIEVLVTNDVTGNSNITYKFYDMNWEEMDLSWKTDSTEYKADDIEASAGMAILAYTMESGE